MRFEKWQALGNDYVIVERAALPFALSPERVRALCAPHTGIGADGSGRSQPAITSDAPDSNPQGQRCMNNLRCGRPTT